MLVTLGPGSTGAEVFSAGRKNGSSFHELSAARGEGAGGRGAAGGGAGANGRCGGLNTCVTLPSAEAESETPGEEKPFGREGKAGGAGPGASSEGRGGG